MIWTVPVVISGVLIIYGFLSGSELEMPIWLYLATLIGFLWMYWRSYKEFKNSYYRGTNFSNRSNSKIEDTSIYEYTSSATDTDLVESAIKSSSAKKIVPPESFFSIPRKIDWDELNKTRKYHGDLGELFVYDLEKNYLTKVGRSDFAEKVQHVAKEGDGHGYDIKSFYENGAEKFIEVKATNASSGSTFNISKNEFSFLQTHLNNSVVYHVHNVNSERETTLVIYPASEVINSPGISPSGYVVKM